MKAASVAVRKGGFLLHSTGRTCIFVIPFFLHTHAIVMDQGYAA